MNNRVLPVSFLCILLSAARITFGMQNQQTLSIFYAKTNDQYLQLDQQGYYNPQKNIAFQLSQQHPTAHLLYDNNTHNYLLTDVSSTIIAHIGTLDDKLIKQLNTIITRQDYLYAKLNNNNYTRITSIESPIPSRSDSLNSVIERLKKAGNIDIIDNEDIENLKDNKFSFFPSYKTIAKSLAILVLMYITIKYIHRLPQLFNKILTIKYDYLNKSAQ